MTIIESMIYLTDNRHEPESTMTALDATRTTMAEITALIAERDAAAVELIHRERALGRLASIPARRNMARIVELRAVVEALNTHVRILLRFADEDIAAMAHD